MIVVVERGAGRAPSTAHKAAAVHEDQHRARRCGGCIVHEDVEGLSIGVGSEFEVACDLDARVGLVLVQRGVDLGRLRRVDHRTQRSHLRLDVCGHAARLRHGGHDNHAENEGDAEHLGRRVLGHGVSLKL